MRLRLNLILLLLFAASVPTVWGQDAGGDDEDEMHDGHGSEAVGDEEPEPDEGADSEAWDESEAQAEEAIDDESGEFADEDGPLADEESDAGDDDAGADMPDDEGSDTDMTESEGGDATAEETSDSAETGESEAEDASNVASEQAEEEEEADDTADGEDIVEADDAAAHAPEGAVQPTDGGRVESAGGNRANANPQIPTGAPASPPAPAQPSSAPAPERGPCPPVAQPRAEGNTLLLVGNLASEIDQQTLLAHFSIAGTVKSVRIVTDSSSGRSRGFAYVEMSDSATAQLTIEQLDGTDLNGRVLRVSEVRTDAAESQGGGRTRGGGSNCLR